MIRPNAAAVAVAAALTLALTACSSSAGTSAGPSGARSTSVAAAPSPAKPTVLMDWFPNPDHASLYLAQKEGTWTKAGLSGVTLQPPSGNQDALKLVSIGSMPLGISYEANTIIAASQGLDVTAVGALVPRPLNAVIVRNGSGVQTIADLAGKKIGTYGDPASEALLDTILTKNGVDPSSIQLITVNQGLIPAMLSGNVDAIIGGYRNIEAIQLQLQGQPPKVFPVEEQGVPDHDELVIIARKSRLESDAGYRAMVTAFLSGLAEGDSLAQSDNQAAIDALQPHMNSGDYTGEQLAAMVPATTKLYRNPAGFGEMDEKKWQAFADWMHENKLIDTPVKAGDAETTAYLPSESQEGR